MSNHRKIITSYDGNNKGMDNSFPDGDNEVNGSPFTVGTSPVSIALDPEKPNEVLCYIEGTQGNCYITYSESRNADATKDFPFPAKTFVSIPNNGGTLKALGDDASIKLRLFYSKVV